MVLPVENLMGRPAHSPAEIFKEINLSRTTRPDSNSPTPRRRTHATHATCTPILPTRMHEFLDNCRKFFHLIMGVLSYYTLHRVYVHIALTEVHSRSQLGSMLISIDPR